MTYLHIAPRPTLGPQPTFGPHGEKGFPLCGKLPAEKIPFLPRAGDSKPQRLRRRKKLSSGYRTVSKL
jgi:hypothetical protein